MSRASRSSESNGTANECVVTLGSTLTAVSNPGMLSDGWCLPVLRCERCDWDPRDGVYTAPMELGMEKAGVLHSRMNEDTKEKNRVFYTGLKRRTEIKLFLGYCWTRLKRVDQCTLFFDDADANRIVGELHIYIPTLTFFSGSTAEEIANLCSKSALSHLFAGSP